MSTAAIMASLSVLMRLACVGQAYGKVPIDGFTVDRPSTSFSDETCQCKDTKMQQPLLHFLFISSSSSLVRGRVNDAVNTDVVCTVILGPHCLLSALTASATVENQTPRREEKASILFNKLPGRLRGEKEALGSALHWPGLAKQQLRGETR